MLLSQGRVAAWPLVVAAEERQHAIAIHYCLCSLAALLASPGPISPHLHKRNFRPGRRLARLLAGHLLTSSVLLRSMHTPAPSPRILLSSLSSPPSSLFLPIVNRVSQNVHSLSCARAQSADPTAASRLAKGMAELATPPRP
jgi:hypothetical protein